MESLVLLQYNCIWLQDAVLNRLAPRMVELLNDPTDPTKFLRNLLKLEVFYQEFNFETIIEKPAYLVCGVHICLYIRVINQ